MEKLILSRQSSAKSQRTPSRMSNHTTKVLDLDANQSLVNSFNELPLEIICIIMNYLTLNERKIVSMVCKKFRYAYEQNYIQYDNILFKANNNLITLLNVETKFCDKLVNLEFKGDDIQVSQIIKNFKQQQELGYSLINLKTIKFESCSNLNIRLLIDLLSIIPNLQTLSIIKCDTMFMSSVDSKQMENFVRLDTLNTLILSKNRYLNDYYFNLFISMIPNLRCLDISYTHLTKSKLLASSVGFSNALFTYENLLEKIKTNAKNLKSLNLSGIELFNNDSLNGENLTKLLVDISELKLDELILENLNMIKVKTLGRIAAKQDSLKHLNINNSVQYDDDGIDKLLSEMYESKAICGNINTLNLRKSKFVMLDVLLDISKLNNLVYLDLSYCMFNRLFVNKTQLNNYIYTFASSLSKCKNLETLILSYCEFIVDDNFVKIISYNLRKLKHLDLNNCGQITDTSVHYICTYLKQLEYLGVGWCKKLTNNAFNKRIDKENMLTYETSYEKHTSFGFCKCDMCKKSLVNGIRMKPDVKGNNKMDLTSAENDPIKYEINEDASVRDLKCLKTLKVEALKNLNDFGIEHGVNLNQLIEFDLKLCVNVTGSFVKCLNGVNVNFKIINLNQCVNYTEENLLNLIKSSSYSLKQLHVSACPAMTNRIIEKLIKEKVNLTYLDVSYCSNIDENTIDLYEHYIINQTFNSNDFFIDKRFISKSLIKN